MRLSPHFTLAEMSATSTGLPNVPTAIEIARLTTLCLHTLEPLRARFGPLRVTSGYRSPDVNARVGGAKQSAHRYGCAADLQPMRAGVTVREMWEWVATSGLDFDQSIWERRNGAEWLHLGIRPPWLDGDSRRQSFKQWR